MTVAVIGAGPCGLIATKTLLEQGLEVMCFEASSEIGGHWKLNNPSGKSAAYESLTTNTNKRMSRLSDFSIPQDWPELPSHRHMHQWWCDYAKRFALFEAIQLEHEVVRVEPQGERWLVCSVNDGTESEQLFDAVVLASGNFWSPNEPNIPGRFSGRTLHSLHYRSPKDPIECQDQRILVVGTGNTGCELALELSSNGAREVYLSARSGNWILPKYIAGPNGQEHIASRTPPSHPLDEVPAFLKLLPEGWRSKLFSQLGSAFFKRQFSAEAARLQSLGLPPAPQNPLAKRPTVADGLADALERKQLRAVAGIKSADGQQINLTDGNAIDVDIILFATGYNLRYPYVDQSVLDTSKNDLQLFRGLMHPEHHNLFVVGVSRPSGGFWPIAEVQAKLIAKLLTGAYRLPDQTKIERHTGSVLKGESFNPALYGLSLAEESQRQH